MKKILIGLFALISLSAEAQFNGKLIYQLDANGYRNVMTYVQNGTNAVVTAYTIKLNNGVPDTTTLHAQDTLLFDLAAGTETHLQYITWRAIKTKYISVIEANYLNKAAAGVTVTPAAGQTVGGYNCKHYLSTSKSGFGTFTKDVFTTDDIGGSPTLWVVGAFLYYTPGFPGFTKLTAAGATGVVVQVINSGSKQGHISTLNLIYCDPKFVPRARGYFSVPSRYTLIDNTNFDFSTLKKVN